MAATPPAHEDYSAVRARSRKVWSLGDYGPTSRRLEPAAVALIAALGVGADDRVLDVAAGQGNCAIAADRAGARVVASDFSAQMVQHGSARTRRSHPQIAWVQADATALPFRDATFDCVTSTFGAIFAPEQDAMAAELVRVLAPGGRVGLTAWLPGGSFARTQSITREYLPAPDGPPLPDPFVWGDREFVRSRFTPLGCDVAIDERTVTFAYASWDGWREEGDAHGMAVLARELLGPDRYAEMRERHREVLSEESRSDDGGIAYDLRYLEIVARRRAGGTGA